MDEEIYQQIIYATTILLITARYVYWVISGRHADREKKKITPVTTSGLIKKSAIYSTGIMMYAQLFGLKILPLPYNNTPIQFLGYLLVMISVFVALVARKELGTNWTHGADYQIKEHQTLVTTGIYSHIRHPIYLSFILLFIGIQIVVESYIVFIFLLILPYLAYRQALKEDMLLETHFGDEFKKYKARTYLFIPYLL